MGFTPLCARMVDSSLALLEMLTAPRLVHPLPFLFCRRRKRGSRRS